MRTKKHEILVSPGLSKRKKIFPHLPLLYLDKEYTMIVLQATDAQ